MYYNSDQFELFPDNRDPVTGDWLPMSESEKARKVRAKESLSQNARMVSLNSSAILSLLTSILK